MRLKDINIGTLNESIMTYNTLVRLGVIKHTQIWRTHRKSWYTSKEAYIPSWNPLKDGFKEGCAIIGIIGLAEVKVNMVFSSVMLLDANDDPAFVLTDLAAVMIGGQSNIGIQVGTRKGTVSGLNGASLLPYYCSLIESDPKGPMEGWKDPTLGGDERIVHSHHTARSIELALQGRSYPWVSCDA